MDRNSIIGFGLIALLLFVYFNWFAPSPEVVKQPLAGDSLAIRPQQNFNALPSTPPADSIFAPVANIPEETVTLENDDIRLVFSNKGAVIREAELKNYKTYSQEPLLLVTPQRSKFSLTGSINGTAVDLYQPMYKINKSTVGDSVRIEFYTNTDATGEIKHT